MTVKSYIIYIWNVSYQHYRIVHQVFLKKVKLYLNLQTGNYTLAIEVMLIAQSYIGYNLNWLVDQSKVIVFALPGR